MQTLHNSAVRNTHQPIKSNKIKSSCLYKPPLCHAVAAESLNHHWMSWISLLMHMFALRPFHMTCFVAHLLTLCSLTVGNAYLHRARLIGRGLMGAVRFFLGGWTQRRVATELGSSLRPCQLLIADRVLLNFHPIKQRETCLLHL